MEITQIRGDGETHPFLPPGDELADFGKWDNGNRNGSVTKENGMPQYEYGRPALRTGEAIAVNRGGGAGNRVPAGPPDRRLRAGWRGAAPAG